MAKRLFDILVASVALIALLPLIITFALVIRKDGGKAFYSQIRVGLNGKNFRMWKLRSMIPDAEKVGGHATLAGDKRVTRIGRFIRKTSIDELPQLFNVFVGDMSLVGPRPNVPAQISEYSPEQWELRNSVLPGVTGLAQAELRSRATWIQRWDLDEYYVLNRSFLLDMKIIFKTLTKLFSSNGN